MTGLAQTTSRGDAGSGRSTIRPRRWPHRLLKGLVILVAICVVLTGGAYVYVKSQLAHITRLDIPGIGDSGSDDIMNVLLVGSDSRERLTGDAAAQAGKNVVAGARSDTIMVLHIDPRDAKAVLLSVPRDLYVPIAGQTGRNRINSAFNDGGAKTLIDTIESSLGIPINHYVEVDFVGFKDIVDAVGGVQVYVPAPARDRYSGLDLKTPGCITLNGTQGLAFVRSRYYESYESGRWRTDPTADLGRIQRQQDFIRRMLRKAVSSGISSPATLNKLIGIGVRDVTLDSEMSTTDIARLGRRFKSLDPETVDMLTLPTRATTIGGASVLLLQKEQAQPYIDRLNGRGAPVGAPTGAQPADVRVRVLNGTGADGLAGSTGQALADAGFNVADRGDADSYAYTKTVIRHAIGQRAKAELLQARVGGTAVIQEDRSLRTVDVVLVVGADFKGVRAGAAPSPSPTSPATTVAPPASTPRASGATSPAC